MSLERIEVSTFLPVPPERLFAAWLDADAHGAFSGGGAASVDPTVGGLHTAWDGYITGRNVALEPGRRIVQTWRSADFPEAAVDSTIEIRLEADGDGTRLTLSHFDIPEGQGEMYRTGWEDHYFEPMRRFFGGGDQAPAATEKPMEAKAPTLENAPGATKPAAAKATAATAKAAAKPAKKAAAKPAKKAAAKKAAAKPAKKAAAKKAAAKPAKRAAAKKAKPAKKAAAKKAKPAKKAAAKKAKAPVKKAAAKRAKAKPPTKKPAAKKAKKRR